MQDLSANLAARLSIRERPAGSPIMYQTWDKLLFIHWPIPAKALRDHIPQRLTIDTFDGRAWIAITPFTVRNSRPRFVPSLPRISYFHEINVRTYVHLDGIPGVWFFSLDANRAIPVLGARAFFHLPYFLANMHSEEHGSEIVYSSRRKGLRRKAQFNARWTLGAATPPARPGSLDFFLVERYCLYTAHKRRLYSSRIYHEPWQLYEAELTNFASTMLEAKQITQPKTQPILHHAEEVSVDIWPLEPVEE